MFITVVSAYIHVAPSVCCVLWTKYFIPCRDTISHSIAEAQFLVYSMDKALCQVMLLLFSDSVP